MLSRFCSKGFGRAISRALYPNKQLPNVFFRAYAGTFETSKVNKARSKLTKVLEQEIGYETENYAPDETTQRFLSEHGFLLRESREDNSIEITKRVGRLSVRVWFHSKIPHFHEEGQEGEQDPNHQHDQNCDHDPCEFIVYVVQPNGQAMVSECTAQQGEINIKYLALVDDVEEDKINTKKKKFDTFSVDYPTLDEGIQTSVLDYLGALGVGEDLALFVEHFAYDKDQRRYVQFLKDARDLVDEPVF